MSIKSQCKNAKRNLNDGFLFIECLIGLMVACWLILLIAVAQKKIIEGHLHIRTQFELMQQAGNTLHRLMSNSPGSVTQTKGMVTLQSERYTIISSEPVLPWLGKKQLPLQAVAVTVKHSTPSMLTFFTALPVQGQS